MKILTPAEGTAPGYIFLGPKMKVVQAGPEIVDNAGNVVWFHPLDTHGVSDVRVQHYRGKPVITWWRGHAPMGVGSGYYAIYDDTYHQIAQVHAGHGLSGEYREAPAHPGARDWPHRGRRRTRPHGPPTTLVPSETVGAPVPYTWVL